MIGPCPVCCESNKFELILVRCFYHNDTFLGFLTINVMSVGSQVGVGSGDGREFVS